MTSVLPLSLFIAGLASGLHCAGMCGGSAAGFSLLQKVAVWKRQLAFNAGRITSDAGAINSRANNDEIKFEQGFLRIADCQLPIANRQSH